jgi:hypothetical protein
MHADRLSLRTIQFIQRRTQVKKLFAFIFWPKFRILRNKTKNLALNQFKINRANIQDLLLIIDLHASLASPHSQMKKGKITRIFANTDYGRNV